MKIAIDAGHGLYTSGKRCLKSIDPKETREWYLNSRIASKVVDKLKNYGIPCIRVDDRTGLLDVPLSERADIANVAKVDYYISIHHDSGIGGGSGGGMTVFSHTNSSATSDKLRDMLYNNILANTGLKGNRSNPLQKANFAVLRETNMPAALIECGFMDSTTDTPIILTETFAQQIADGITKTVCELYGIEYKQEEEPEMKKYNYVPDMPEWARSAATKAIKKGIIKLDADGKASVWECNLQPLVWLERCGLLD